MKIKKWLKPLVVLALCASMTFPAQAAFDRNAGIFNKERGFFMYSQKYGEGILYFEHNEGGFTVYVPYHQSDTGQEIFKNMFKYMFSAYEGGKGSNTDAAGAKFTAPGTLSNINGITTSHYVKNFSTYGGESVKATTDIHDLSPDYNVEFRYSGVMIYKNKSNTGSVVTNPTYPSDRLQDKPNRFGGPREYMRFKKKALTSSEGTSFKLYGGVKEEVYTLGSLVKDYKGSNTIPRNFARESEYYGTAQEVFTKWAERTEIGARYKEYYTGVAAKSGQEWWEYLRDYIRIDGDLGTQSVLLTAVHIDQGSYWYTTYSIPYPIENNTVATRIQLLDEKDNIIDKSERPASEIESGISGADSYKTNVLSDGKPVKLEPGKTYKLECALAYVTTRRRENITDKGDPLARPIIQVRARMGGGGYEADAPNKELETANTKRIQEMDVDERIMNDTNLSGPIRTRIWENKMVGSEVIRYFAGLAGYNIVTFTVDETFPKDGVLRFVVPKIFDQNGENGYNGDDIIELAYFLDDVPDIPDDPQPEQYGDMNLGRREYRALHYKKTEEENDLDKPIMTTDPNTGEQVETGEYEKKQVDYEYVTEFGWHESYGSAPDGEKAGEWSGVPESSGSIYPIDEKS